MNSSLENRPLKVVPIKTRFLQYATAVASVLVFILKAQIILQDVEPPHKTQLTTVERDPDGTTNVNYSEHYCCIVN